MKYKKDFIKIRFDSNDDLPKQNIKPSYFECSC